MFFCCSSFTCMPCLRWLIMWVVLRPPRSHGSKPVNRGPSGAFFCFGRSNCHEYRNAATATICCRSLALLILAAISHVPAVLLFDLWGYEQLTSGQFLSDLVKPILLGTEYYTSAPWFFVVLALTRLLVYAFVRNKAWFVISLLAVGAAAWAADRLGLTDNLYEWRNLPVALPLFFLGVYLPNGWKSAAMDGVRLRNRHARDGACQLSWRLPLAMLQLRQAIRPAAVRRRNGATAASLSLLGLRLLPIGICVWPLWSAVGLVEPSGHSAAIPCVSCSCMDGCSSRSIRSRRSSFRIANTGLRISV